MKARWMRTWSTSGGCRAMPYRLHSLTHSLTHSHAHTHIHTQHYVCYFLNRETFALFLSCIVFESYTLFSFLNFFCTVLYCTVLLLYCTVTVLYCVVTATVLYDHYRNCKHILLIF
jgi:hypothetical protein